MLQRLRSSSIVSSTLIILGFIFCLQCSLGFFGKGSVRVPHIIDAGTVKAGDVVKVVIPMRNLTPLPIKSFSESSCGCSVLDKTTIIIPPFSTENTNVEINTSGLKIGESTKQFKINFYYSTGSWEEVVEAKMNVR